jgi:hypothetical protein
MKQAVWLALTCAVTLAPLWSSAGCALFTSDTPSPFSTPAPDAPRPVTNLSELAPGNALDPFGKQHDQTIARRVTSDDDSEAAAVENLGALGTVRHTGDEKHPCEQRLLNKKAAQFDTISMRLMDQVFTQISVLQEQDEISDLKLPTDLKWAVITGTLNSKGVLKELVIEQHSGTAAVDRMLVAACKKGLYLHNPPTGAADDGGNYQVRIEARMENFASLDGEHWEFKTYMGLAIL